MNRRSFVKNAGLGFGAIPLLRNDWLDPVFAGKSVQNENAAQ